MKETPAVSKPTCRNCRSGVILIDITLWQCGVIMIISGRIETVYYDNRGNKTHEISSRQNELLKLLAHLNLDLVAKKEESFCE